MPGDTIRDLFIGLGVKADTEKLERFDRAVESTKAGMGALLGITQKLALGLTALLGLQALNTKEFANETLEIQRQAESLGITNKRYQELMGTFQQFGLEGDDIADAFNTITDRANDAVGGVKSMIDDFGLVGVKVQQLKDKKPDELFDIFADAVANTTDISKRNTAIVRILGDDIGRKLLPLISQGTTGFKQYAKELQTLGVIMDDAGIKRAAAYAQQNKRLGLAMQGLRNTLSLAIIPTLTKATKSTADFFVANMPWIQGKIQAGMRDAKDVLERLDVMLVRIGGGSREEGIKRVGGALTAIFSGPLFLRLLPLASAVLAKFMAIGLLPLLVMAAKLIALAAIFTLVALAVEDFIIYLRGGPSVTAKFIKAVKEWFAELRKGNATFDAFMTGLEELASFVMDIFELVGNVVSAVWGRVWGVAQPILTAIMGAVQFVGGIIASVWQTVFNEIVIPLFELFAAIARRVFRFIADELGFLLEYWDIIFGGLAETVDGALGMMLKGFMTVFGTLRRVVEPVLTWMEGKLKFVLETIGKGLRLLRKLVDETPEIVDTGIAGRSLAAATGSFGDLNQAVAERAAGGMVAQNRTSSMSFTSAPSITVNPSAGMDERALARETSRQIQEDQANAARQMRARAPKER